MAKKSKKQSSPIHASPPPTRWQWFRKPWAAVVAVVAAVGAFLLNINPILTNVRQLPSELRKTNDQFVDWLYQDEAWKGYWRSETIEGEGESEIVAISPDGRMGLDLMEVADGEIDGTIATPQTCDLVPAFDYLLVKGKVQPFGRRARVIVWDTVLGKSLQFAELELNRDEKTLSVQLLDGYPGLFPETISIGRQTNGSVGLEPICDPKKREAWLRSLIKGTNKGSTTEPSIAGAGASRKQ